ncbi:cobaltochelatase subunit CobN [Luteimonas sp. BDR2-5]|uniref:cobaltochelatase subunit CobN n=1 Tax=Proluteimonas luteida TaxID=2878685 RepID=UPI001E46C36E|nr:cobaltochelatase subunit CobN [Luteimonas sp. BDR2-5]MCD9028199.1 cobaltochelatase subunit CobN [Luteimonas sp. BDR2-5]
MRRWLCRGLACLALTMSLCAGASADDGAGPQVLVQVVASDFVLPSKVARLDALGRDQGVRFEYVPVERDGAAARVAGADLVILDTPRPSDVERVQSVLGDALATSAAPWVRVGGGPPASGALDGAQARRIAGYYAGGGEANYRHLADYLLQWKRGGDLDAVPAPRPMPDTGYYHPAAGDIFDRRADFAAWRQRHAPGPGVALLVSAGSVAALQTALVDKVIERAAAHGIGAFGVWFDDDDPAALREALDGLGAVAVVNMTHLQQGGLRAAEFLALDVPVIQGLNARQQDPDAWRAAASGVPASLAATFIAVPEIWGASDPLVLGAVARGEQVAIPEQVELLAGRLARIAALRAEPAADKRLALLFWNYPAGEKNLSASNLNLPRSIAALSQRLRDAGYRVDAASEREIVDMGQAMLGGYYRPETLDALLRDDLADSLPVARYRQWLDTLPPPRRDALLAQWGDPARHASVRTIDGEPAFVFPRARLGDLLLMPQPPRAGRIGEAAHDQEAVPSHYYLAAYLYLREGFAADALIHFGTHGTQEWTPGKDRALWAGDYPYLAVGDVPVFYPYVQDNIGEAMQAKRRGRAVTISHQVPAFAPAGLYDEMRDLHALIHQYQQLDAGGVRLRTGAAIGEAALAAGIAGDMGWDRAAIAADIDGFLPLLHDHLHELARSAMPLGLHTFGEPAADEHRLSTVMQQLGAPFYEALGLDPDEVFAADFAALAQSLPYRTLAHHLHGAGRIEETGHPALRAQLARARELDAALLDTQETESLLRGLAGGFVPPGPGGDPLRDPGLRSGRNLHALEPDKVPTPAAYETGGEALQQLVDAYRRDHGGDAPAKLAFSLWSSETIRQLGVQEAQVLHALGLRPVWDAGGRLTALEIIPASELGRPRIDVVVQATSVYRDQFDGFMRLLAAAIERLAAEGDAGNAVARNSAAVAERLRAQGVEAARAQALSTLRIFSNAPGEYGSDLSGAVLDDGEDAAKDDATLAGVFLSRLQYGYGASEQGVSVEGANVFAEQLRGVQAAVLSRSSNTHGVLSTDHPFEYLGGLSLAIRHLDGASPALYVSDLRSAAPRTTGAAQFLAAELRSRQLNPQWIGAMQQEGYAGTLQVLDAVNNLYGWQSTAPDVVRDAQWQAMHDTYVRDVRQLGIDQWFERDNPTAQAQMIQRMREAIARGYWQADARTRAELEARLQAIGQALSATDTTASAAPAPGFGTNAPDVPAHPAVAAPVVEPPADAATAPEPAAAPPQVRGRVMRQVEPPPAVQTGLRVPVLLLLALCLVAGAWRQLRGGHRRIHSLFPDNRTTQ